eukprot:TRINITY_DN2945_c0_g1_i2.p1 TRINITY_DN2945_c0_g1~~TRINITY_DN2945_c0_g1_i2.p1  ORF type:complete len:450 (-),score=116.02 TRINITY_DN2945_c0_g1_i2:123-1472(-)
MGLISRKTIKEVIKRVALPEAIKLAYLNRKYNEIGMETLKDRKSLIFNKDNMNSEMFLYQSRYLPNVETLILDDIELETESFLTLMNFFPLIKKLSLKNCSFLGISEVEEIILHDTITHLNFEGCCRLTDVLLCDVSIAFPELVGIELSHCDAITADSLKQLSQNCNALKYLSVIGLTCIDDSVLKSISKFVPSIEYLILDNCEQITDEGILCIAQTCSNLVELSLKNCKNITNRSIDSLSGHSNEVGCPKLHLLDISNTNCGDNENNGNLVNIFEILNRFKEMEFLRMNGIDVMMFEEIKFEEMKKLKCLEMVDVNVPENFKDIITPLINCNCIEELAFGPGNIKEFSFLSELKHLRKLTLKRLSIENRCLSEILSKCINLEVLSLIGCPKISVEAFQCDNHWINSIILKVLISQNNKSLDSDVNEILNHLNLKDEYLPIHNWTLEYK